MICREKKTLVSSLWIAISGLLNIIAFSHLLFSGMIRDLGIKTVEWIDKVLN